MALKRKFRNLFLVFLIGLPLLFFGVIFLRMLNPYSYILSNTDNQSDQISMYKNILSDAKFSKLLNKLLHSNDIRTIHSVAFYCKENSMCNQIGILEIKAKELYNIPKDSTWLTEINYSYTRKSSRKMLDFPNNLQYNLKLLKEKCK